MEPQSRQLNLGCRALISVLTTAMIIIGAETAPGALPPMSGSLTVEDAVHSVGAEAQQWHVEYFGQDERPYANGSNWEFRASAGEITKTFKSGTEIGDFVLVRTYKSLALIGADVGSGAWGFTLYDLEAERKLVEFWAGFPHLSPDNRYLVYRKFQNRRDPFYPEVKIIDLAEDWSDVDMNLVRRREGIGEVVFPRPPPAGRPELEGAYGYGSTVEASPFNHVAWDMDNGTLYFTGTDRTGHLNLVTLRLGPTPRAVCYVPLTIGRLRSEYFDPKWVHPTGVILRSPDTVTVTTSGINGVNSDHNVPLRVALNEGCLEQ